MQRTKLKKMIINIQERAENGEPDVKIKYFRDITRIIKIVPANVTNSFTKKLKARTYSTVNFYYTYLCSGGLNLMNSQMKFNLELIFETYA